MMLPANLPPLATHEDVQALTGVDYDPAKQARLTLILAAVSRRIRRDCGWHVFPLRVADELVVDGSGSPSQMLPTLALRDVRSVVVDGIPLAGPFEWSQNGYLRLPVFTRRLRGVVASVDHGFDAGDVADLRLLACEVAARGLDESARPGLRQLQTGPFSAQWDGPDMTPDELARLAPFTIGQA